MYITEEEAIHHILENQGKFSLYVGAGASVASGVKTARQISEDIREKLLSSSVINESDVNSYLDWDKQTLRYTTCIQKGLKTEISRINYFKKLLEGKKPSFFHYGSSLLVSHNVLRNITITTNFDKLLEVAFSHIGEFECQPIRMAEECKFMLLDDSRKSYVFKLHGDYDTGNILNTRDETTILDKDIYDRTENLLHNSGLLVIGSAGYEKSIHTLIDALTTEKNLNAGVLRYGLLWGVYMGQNKPANLKTDQVTEMLRKKIESETICNEIVNRISKISKTHEMFTFFPIWGAGEFIHNLVKSSKKVALMEKSKLYLDHEMRLRDLLTSANVDVTGIDKHIATLNLRKEKYNSEQESKSKKPELAVKAIHSNDKSTAEIRVYYGNIARRAFLNFNENSKIKKIVVSPDDTFLSAGGGVAYSLLEKGGKTKIINELHKLSPVKRNDVAITSGFELPVSYIFHAAAIEIDKNANYLISKESLKESADNIFRMFDSLKGEVIFIPLLGSGLGGMTPIDSFEIILKAILSKESSEYNQIYNIVISEEKKISRNTVVELLKGQSGPKLDISVY